MNPTFHVYKKMLTSSIFCTKIKKLDMGCKHTSNDLELTNNRIKLGVTIIPYNENQTSLLTALSTSSDKYYCKN